MTELKEDGKVETILETTAKLTPVLDAHKKILEEKMPMQQHLLLKSKIL